VAGLEGNGVKQFQMELVGLKSANCKNSSCFPRHGLGFLRILTFLYTGGVSCALYISLLISKLSRFSGPISLPMALVMYLAQMGEQYEVNTFCTAGGGGE
jgi:hypothetical protein